MLWAFPWHQWNQSKLDTFILGTRQIVHGFRHFDCLDFAYVPCLHWLKTNRRVNNSIPTFYCKSYCNKYFRNTTEIVSKIQNTEDYIVTDGCHRWSASSMDVEPRRMVAWCAPSPHTPNGRTDGVIDRRSYQPWTTTRFVVQHPAAKGTLSEAKCALSWSFTKCLPIWLWYNKRTATPYILPASWDRPVFSAYFRFPWLMNVTVRDSTTCVRL